MLISCPSPCTMCIQTCSMKAPAIPTGLSHLMWQSMSMPEVGRACGHVGAIMSAWHVPHSCLISPRQQFCHEAPCHGRHGIFACRFSMCITMAYNNHCHRFSCAAMPHGGCTAPIHEIGSLSFWSFGRISMHMRPRYRAALVRALPIFVCRILFFCGSGQFPKHARAPDGRGGR